ncbi:MAG: IPT/TIG domain-containing protein [Candidatus Geothermincolia bacterium]
MPGKTQKTLRYFLAFLIALSLALPLFYTAENAHAVTAGWAAQTSGTASDLRAIGPASATVAWAGGADGDLIKTADGGTWGAATSESLANIRGIAAVDANHAWFVTEDTLILIGGISNTVDGADWDLQLGLAFSLHAISAGSTSHLWAVGELGNIVATQDGGVDLWPAQLSGTLNNLNGVSAVDEQVAWVAGNNGHVLRCDAGGYLPDTWDDMNSGVSTDFRAVAAVDLNTAWVVGDGGVIMKHTASGWATQTSGTAQTLYGVWALDANTAWTVGGNGTILYTTNGGATWTAQTSGTTATLYGVQAVDANTVWTVGSGGTVLKSTSAGLPVYDVVASVSGGNGSVDPASQGVTSGGTATIDLLAAAGYHVTRITVNGVQQLLADPFVISNVLADKTVVVYFGIASATGFSPTSGHEGTIVTISGSGFGDSRGASYVTFGGVPVTEYLSWSDGEIQVGVPDGAPASSAVAVVTTGNTSTAPGVFTVTGVEPVVSDISPLAGPEGTLVTISGENFGDTQGSGYVTFGGVLVTEYVSWSDGEIVVKVPAGAAENSTIVVVTDSGSGTSTQQFVVQPADAFLWYFAEGYTGAGFQEYICLGNSNTSVAQATITYMFRDGTNASQVVSVPAQGRATVDVNGAVGAGKEVSAKVQADKAIVAERPMYFTVGGTLTGGTDTVGATYPANNWYFAEGTTLPGFLEYICVLNPGDTAATVNLEFQTEEEGLISRGPFSVGAHSRETFLVNSVLGEGYQTSLQVKSSVPVVAERPMYFIYAGMGGHAWAGGHCVMGTPTLETQYYFAEGNTRYQVGSYMEEWLTLQNPNAFSITVDATYQLGAGQGDPVTASYTLDAGRRRTVYVPGEVGLEKDVSVRLASTSSFLAERPMYFNYQGYGAAWAGGHCVIGSPRAGADWFLAEGFTGAGFHQYLCLQNPGATDASVEIHYYVQDAAPLAARTLTVPANSRVTVFVNENAGPGYQLSTEIKVTAGPDIVVERPMYYDYFGMQGGHDVVGYQP